MDFSQLFHGISQKILLEIEQMTTPGSRGAKSEELIIEFLRRHLPGKYAIGNGSAIAVSGEISPELDVVIYDQNSCPKLYYGSRQIFPSESVCSVVEIKRSLNTSTLKNCIEQIRSIRKLPKLGGKRTVAPGMIVSGNNPSTFGAVFSLTSDVPLKTLRDKFNVFNNSIPPSERISLVCILDKGLLINVNPLNHTQEYLPTSNSKVASIESTENSLLLFYLMLSAYLNSIEVMPPDLFKYTSKFMSEFNWEIK
ncbi:DUF6602 domain-containing protein [Peribacillus simplex]|uniref:DUF6602 domain-containing protein n=1 Tax=Peribacillus simplex TaxID=1478 RepID=UPI003CEEC50B